jgi:hypothetical protein
VEAALNELRVGSRVRITQAIARRAGPLRSVVEGTVQAVKLDKTGSWYAHARDDRYWLRRVTLRKADGEITSIALDQYSQIEVLDGDTGADARP